MSRKGRDSHLFKHGFFGGWTDYRYGSPNPRPITLAGKKAPPPIYRGEKRKHVVSKAMDVLRDWRQSPFEKEGAVRAGLRSALCLQGYDWSRSDHQAAEIVADGLRLLGAKRPSYEQGQREYTTPRENCVWCGIEVPPELLVSRHNTRYCSAECAQSALFHRNLSIVRRETDAYHAAFEVIKRTSNPKRRCAQCGVKFHPLLPDGRYCSKKCMGLGMRTVPEKNCPQCGKLFRPERHRQELCSIECRTAQLTTVPDATCQECGKTFRPPNAEKDGRGKYCSRPCAEAARSKQRVLRRCVCCGSPFIARSNKARFCGSDCHYLFTRKGGAVAYITPPVFDFVFRQAA